MIKIIINRVIRKSFQMPKDSVRIRIELNEKIICQKKLDISSSLSSIREKIKDKIGRASFLDTDGNIIDTNDENDFTLSEIISDNILKVKDLNSTNDSGIIIFLDNSRFCSINIGEDETLAKLRSILNDKIKNDFEFIDTNGNLIGKEEEEEFTIKEQLKDDIIKIKSLMNNTPNNTSDSMSTSTNSVSAPPSIPNEFGLPKAKYDLSKYKKIDEVNGMTYYLYSEKQPQSNHNLVKQYYFDEFEDVNNYKDAKIILFVGKTGDGKTTAINAFFNVIKGVKLEDKFRFILIKEPEKEKDQSKSQTDGVHIYYIKDELNRPIIILDSQGFGDTRGLPFDQKVIDAFAYIFSEVIDHINAISFIVKSTDARLDINLKYIINQVSGLFSEDISINFFALATHAIKQNIDNPPAMIKTLEKSDGFREMTKKMQKKWYYAIDSTSILELFEDDTRKMALFSYKQLMELYNEKVIQSRSISIKKCSEVLNIRKELIIQINNLDSNFQNLLMEQENLKLKEKSIQEVDIKIKQAEEKIEEHKERFKNLKGNELEKALNDLNEELSKRIFDLSNQNDTIKVRCLVTGIEGFEYTHCDLPDCKRNCHEPCDCIHLFTTRCTIYPIIGDKCERCGHSKSHHNRDKYRYQDEYKTVKKDNTEELNKVKEQRQKEVEKISNDINKENLEKTSIQNSLSNLEKTISELNMRKEINEKEKNDTEKKIKDTSNEIFIIIIRLQSASQRLNDISMRPDYHKNANEYIDSLIKKTKEVYGEGHAKVKELEKIKKYNEKFLNTVKLKKEEIFKLDHSKLTQLLQSLNI